MISETTAVIYTFHVTYDADCSYIFTRTARVSYVSGKYGRNAAKSPSPKLVRAIKKIIRAPRNFVKEEGSFSRVAKCTAAATCSGEREGSNKASENR